MIRHQKTSGATIQAQTNIAIDRYLTQEARKYDR